MAVGVEVRLDLVHAPVLAARVLEAARVLRDDPDLDCAYFTFLSAIDWQDKGFEVIVTLYSLTHGATVVMHVRLPSEDPAMPTLTGVWQGANWHERECAEMFGIAFEGHPNLVKLYLPEDFEGYPLRKSFRLASRRYKRWPGAKDEDEAAAGGPIR
jgi:NADH-quinone oxidoreductase subunit C